MNDLLKTLQRDLRMLGRLLIYLACEALAKLQGSANVRRSTSGPCA
jgi:hypothetical protein